MSVARRREWIDPAHHCLSIAAQCRLLSISRSSYYYAPVPETDETLALMRVIDAAFLDMPWYGSRQMVRHLRRNGYDVGRRRVRRLMAKMGLSPIYQRPRTSDPHPQHRVYPYLLRKLAIERPNHVWCADVTYIPMRRGFLYLVAIMDWMTRKVLAWRLSNTMDAGFCVAALARFGRSEIFNTDQGSQFTSFAFTSVLRRGLSTLTPLPFTAPVPVPCCDPIQDRARPGRDPNRPPCCRCAMQCDRRRSRAPGCPYPAPHAAPSPPRSARPRSASCS
jgi:hypothetical protein